MTDIGDRMKAYERASAVNLTRRMPLIVRVDGRAFHSFMRGRPKPYDVGMQHCMDTAAADVMKDMQGCVLAYSQSDEVSFFLQDWAEFATEPWFGKKLQKVVSIAASSMTMSFNYLWGEGGVAMFDARAFLVPEGEVSNYFLWRARDWARNSIQMLAQSRFSHKGLQGKSTSDLHEMLHAVGVNWTTDVNERSRNGCFLLPGGERRTDVLPLWEQIDELVQGWK